MRQIKAVRCDDDNDTTKKKDNAQRKKTNLIKKCHHHNFVDTNRFLLNIGPRLSAWSHVVVGGAGSEVEQWPEA